ncbi:MAG: hypothetical protein V4719_31470, partial [Planctomycetota bacterium]
MRIPNKVVCLWSCLAAFTLIHTAVAQDYPAQPLAGAAYLGDASLDDGTQDGYGYGASPEYSPMAYQDGGAGVYADPMAAPPGYPQPMMPPDASYWPNVSPYETPVMQRNYRENGLWVNDSIHGDRKYFMSLEYMRVGFNRPGTDTIGYAKTVTPLDMNGFRLTNAGVINKGEDLLSDGLRAKFIIQNADTSSFEASGFWVGESTGGYQPYGATDPTDIRKFRVRGFLGFDNGVTGTGVAYDSDFKMTYKQQAFGGDLSWYTAPMFETSGFKLRPMFGLKYLKIREEFDFHGASSGFGYLYDSHTGLPFPATFIPGTPYSSDLTSRVTSNLGGPEIGVRYEVGGSHFLLSGQSRFAVLANGESMELAGNGMGRSFPTPTPSNPNPTAFSNSRNNTHVSPTFTQDFQFKGKVFRMLPIFNDIPLFANADMLVGYNFLLVGNVARPTKIID